MPLFVVYYCNGINDIANSWPIIMGKGPENLLFEADFKDFRQWIQLDIDGVTWQGRFLEEFEEFWSVFFLDGVSLRQMMERFEHASRLIKIGPIASWINWLKEKLLIYVFMVRGFSIHEMSRLTEIPFQDLASILRDFFLARFPHLDDQLSGLFQLGNVASPNLFLTFKEIALRLDISGELIGSTEDELMPALEITLYAEWKDFLLQMKKNLYHHDVHFKQLWSNLAWKKYFQIFKEIMALIILGVIFIAVVQQLNQHYQKFLADKISIYEPQLLWLDKTLTFKAPSSGPTSKKFELNLDEVKAIAETREVDREVMGNDSWATESEVILTSWDALPRDFQTADLEKSSYEEERREGYRDTSAGDKKVFRVMMNSADAESAGQKLNQLMSRYGVTQVDNVRPGMQVPGGTYYNLFVPRENLKEFLAQTMQIDESTLYESRTRDVNYPGKNKVFIWIKTL